MPSEGELRALIEEATVDAYGEDEQLVGFFTMIQDHLDVPFETEVLGTQVSVVEVDQNSRGEIVAVCERAGKSQRIPILDLPLPEPRPGGAEWIDAYRLWSGGGS